MAWVRCCGGSSKPKEVMELLKDGVFQNGCTGTGFVASSGVQICQWNAQCTLMLPSYVNGYTQLQFECATTNATGTDVLQATCAGHSGKATTGAGRKTVTVSLNASDVFDRVIFDVVDRNGNINQLLYNVILIP